MSFPDLKPDDVKAFHNAWHETHPWWHEWQERVERAWKHQGYVATILDGRRRYFLGGLDGPAICAHIIQGCIPGFERVLTREGYIPISELEGQRFEAWTGKRWAWATCIRKGYAPMRQVRTDRRVSLLCDPTHGFRFAGAYHGYEWREAQSLHANNRVALDLARELPFGAAFDVEDAYFLGLWLAEGSVTIHKEGSPSVSWTIGRMNKDGRGGARAIAHLLSWLHRRGLRPFTYTKPNGGATSITVRTGGEELLRSWCVDVAWKAATKRVPEVVWRADLAARKSFLRGFLDGDGYNYTKKQNLVSIHLCQKALLEDLWLVARTCGIDGKISARHISKEGHVGYFLWLRAAMVKTSLDWGKGAAKSRGGRSGRTPWWEARRVLDRLHPTSPGDASQMRKIAASKHALSPYVLKRMGVDDIYDHTRITSVSDRRIHLPIYTLLVEDEEHAYVAQGFISKNSAASIVNRATLLIADAIPHRGWSEMSGLAIQVHDDLRCYVPEARVKEALGIMHEAMLYRERNMLFDVEMSDAARWGEC